VYILTSSTIPSNRLNTIQRDTLSSRMSTGYE
jgi:hypothetical protein